MAGFRQSFTIQRRVIGALIMRETYTRFGRENLSFFWVYGEFLIFALPVFLMWHFIRGEYEHGVLVFALIWSGYLPILLFRHIGGHMLRAIKLNISLFYHKNVTPFDAVFARLTVEVLGNYGAALFSFFLLLAIGALNWPRNVPLLLLGYLYMTWWCVSIGIVIAAFSERSTVFEKIWPPISYMYLPASGCFFLAEWLPHGVRTVLLHVMPALSCYEMIRGGLFGPVIQTFYDIPYLTFVLAAITLFGLLGLRDVRRHLVNE
jgi:capsular polysaccharide transport system permease protein